MNPPSYVRIKKTHTSEGKQRREDIERNEGHNKYKKHKETTEEGKQRRENIEQREVRINKKKYEETTEGKQTRDYCI